MAACQPSFDHELLVPDVNKFADLAGHLAHGLRSALLDPADRGGKGAPGTVVVDPHGRIEAVTPEAADRARAGRAPPGRSGLATDEIAQALFLSPHTVRGYLKALFAKVGVGSRGELVARLFADHYHDRLAGTATITLDPP